MTGTASNDVAAGVPKRIWLVAVLFGLVSSAILATVVILATRSSTADANPEAEAAAARSTTVAIVGDSITEQGESALDQVLADDWRLDIDGRAGFTVAEQLPAARCARRRRALPGRDQPRYQRRAQG